jgi:hypothetical protein
MTCATCRYFRRSVVGPVGFCGLDRTRALLGGDEVQPCWQAPTDVADLVSDRPGSGRTSWLTLAERQRGATAPGTGRETGSLSGSADPARDPTAIPTTLPFAALPIEMPPAAPTVEAARPRGGARRPTPVRPAHAIAVYESDDLIDAPVVPPSRKVTSEAQRRSQARRERQRSLDRESTSLRDRVDPTPDG